MATEKIYDVNKGQITTAPFDPLPPMSVAPTAITARQLRLWLVRHGYTLAQVEDMIAAMPEPERTEALIEWEYTTEFERGNPILRRLSGALLRAKGDDLEDRLNRAFAEASAY